MSWTQPLRTRQGKREEYRFGPSCLNGKLFGAAELDASALHNKLGVCRVVAPRRVKSWVMAPRIMPSELASNCGRMLDVIAPSTG